MGDPRGFLKVRTRRELAERPVEERIKDWFDVHAETGLQPWTQTQAARCMDCGTPFCMTGCPLGNLIPEWNDLVRQGKWEDAYNRLSMTNNFPEVTGRICPALCEQACVLGIHQPPTMIKLDEQTIIDQAWDLDYVKPLPPQRLTDQTVAVVGSGPAGLAAAQQLTRAGHTVVVYEKDDAIGGLMRYGIPNFKLEKGLLDRRVKQMEAEGTRFRTNVEIGKDITWDDLRDRYDAVVVAIGSRVPRDMKIPSSTASTSPSTSCPTPRAVSSASSRCTTSPPRTSTSSSSAVATPVPTASAPRSVRVRRTSPCYRSCRKSRQAVRTTARGRPSPAPTRRPPPWKRAASTSTPPTP